MLGQPEAAAIIYWNLKDPYQPGQVLLSDHSLLTFDINPLDPEVVVGGCANGLIMLWELADAKVGSRHHYVSK